MPRLLVVDDNALTLHFFREALAAFGVEFDHYDSTNSAGNRALTEATAFAIRIDVAEELDRLTTHLKETRKLLKQGGSIGRRLDFMMQEFNRESNTLGSKSINAETTQSAVELKVLIEQMREQIQNIE